MLKLRAPIKTVLNPEMISSSESFAERIMGNYRQIGVELSQTDLLHVTNEPPEIFVMDGGMTNLFSASNVENTQIQKTKIINNLINRIVLSADAGFSYQDNVYVTNVLHKLGIKDEKTFLSQVERMFSETREHEKSVSLYWENLETLQTMIREYKSSERNETRIEEQFSKQPVLHLHEEINRRLQTAAIYRVLQNFYESATTPRVLTNEQMMISEQSRVSREILLSMLREEVRMEPAYLTYRHENYYEGDELEGDEVSVESVSNRISSAVLLNLIDNIYDSVYRRVDHHLTNWLSTENTYYGAAENTLFRIEQNTAYLQYLYEQSQTVEENETSFGDESTTLQQLISLYQRSENRLQQSLGGNTYENTFVSNRDMTVEDNRSYENNLTSADMVHISVEGDEGDDISNIQRTESISEQVENIYQQNQIRNQQYLNALQKIVDEAQPKESVGERMARMQRESRMSLERPKEFLQEYRDADKKAKEINERMIVESEKLLSPAQQVAHELIREYLKAPERFYHSEVISEGNLGLMLYDIKEAENAGVAYPHASREDGSQTGGGLENEKENDSAKTESLHPAEILEQRFKGVERVFENETLREREFSSVQERLTQNLGEQVILHHQNTYVSLMTQRIIERWHERRLRPSGSDITYEEIGTSMVHRSKENIIDEEVIESMQEQIRRMEETNQTVFDRTENIETTNRTVINNIVNDSIENNTQVITDIVNSSVKKQLDEISDRVYGKIERQLKNEKRRRGL